MLRWRVSILAAALLLLKVHSTTSSGPARPAQHVVVVGLQPRRRQRFPLRDDLEEEEDDDDDPRHRHPNHHNRRKKSPAEDALSRYPQMGKFEARHRSGITAASRDPCAAEAEEMLDEVEESWMTTLAALAASGTALALQAIPESGCRQHGRRRKRRRPPDVSAAAADALQRLQAELSSRLDTLSSWSRRRRGRILSPPAARQRRRSAPPFSPSQASAAADLATRQHLLQLRAHLSRMTTAAGRRTGALLSAARESGDRGLRITRGYGDLLWRRGYGVMVRSVEVLKRGAAGAAGRQSRQDDEEEEEEGEWEGSRLVRLTDMTVQNVVDVVARDGWEHVATTSGVVVHRQYIALGPDGTPIEEGDTAAATAAGGEATAEPSAVLGDTSSSSSGSSSGGGGGGGNDNAPRFACVKATAIISVPPEVVYLLFADNSRVSEYNEHCREVKDLEVLSQDSKITWAASGRMGPFKVGSAAHVCVQSVGVFACSGEGKGWTLTLCTWARKRCESNQCTM